MAQRAVPDADARGVADRALEIALARARSRPRTSWPSARLAAIADASVHPVPCVCDGVEARCRGTRTNPLASAGDVDALVGRSRCPPLTSTTRGPELEDPPRRRPHVVQRGDAHPGQHLRLGNVRRDDAGRAAAARDRIAAMAASSSSRSPPLATITGSTTRCGRSKAPDRRGDRLDDRGVRQHAGLDRVGADVADHRFDLRDDQRGRDRLPAGHAAGVLRGDRGDRLVP